MIARFPTWRVIGRYGAGFDNVDVEAASRAGIAVVNVPDYCVEEAATHTAALVLAAWRKLFPARRLVDDGAWSELAPLLPIRPLSRCTLGLVGAGRIGTEVVRLLGPFFERGDRVRPVAAGACRAPAAADLDTVFAQSDVLSLHCPLTPETANLVDAARLASMKQGALLVNVSRGGLVDSTAVAEALRSGRLGGLALDVLPTEPPPADEPLLALPNVLVTNHIAWYSDDSIDPAATAPRRAVRGLSRRPAGALGRQRRCARLALGEAAAVNTEWGISQLPKGHCRLPRSDAECGQLDGTRRCGGRGGRELRRLWREPGTTREGPAAAPLRVADTVRRMSGSVSWITYAPVKGLRLQSVDEVELGPTGAPGDRRFHLIAEDGRLINGKFASQLFQVSAESDPEGTSLSCASPTARCCSGRSSSATRSRRTSTAGPCRVTSSTARSRPHSPSSPGCSSASSASTMPGAGIDRGAEAGVSCVSTAALGGLAREAGVDSVDGRRFRMLFGIEGVEAHAEDGWLGRRVAFGDAVVRLEGSSGAVS